MVLNKLLPPLLVALCGLTLAGSASAAGRPVIVRQHITGIDSQSSADLTERCGFAVTVTGDVRETTIIYPDESFVTVVHGTFIYRTAAGAKLADFENYRRLVDQFESRFTTTGATIRIVDIGTGRTLIKDSGYSQFTSDDELPPTIHGPHPFVETFFDFCGALTA